MATLLNKVETVPARPSIVTVPHHVKSPRLGWLRWGALVGLVLALSVAGVLWRAHLQDVIMYETVAVERGSVQAKVTATGNLNAVVNVLVSSQVSGNIKDLYADWNSKVKKGQLVALIDPEIF
jgi:HlyD family secretion protein